MIVSFENEETEKIFKGDKSRLLSRDVLKRALMRLDRIDAVVLIDELRL